MEEIGDSRGWCSVEKGLTLAFLVAAIRPTNTVEIGVWCGRSLIPLALAHKHIGHGIVWAIDSWNADASKVGQDEANSKWWEDQKNHDWAKDECLKNIQTYGVERVVYVIQKQSNDVEPIENVSLLHIDGNHSDQANTDVIRFAPKVSSGGVVVLDDLNWSGDGVRKAERSLFDMGFIQLFNIGTGAVYLKT